MQDRSTKVVAGYAKFYEKTRGMPLVGVGSFLVVLRNTGNELPVTPYTTIHPGSLMFFRF